MFCEGLAYNLINVIIKTEKKLIKCNSVLFISKIKMITAAKVISIF